MRPPRQEAEPGGLDGCYWEMDAPSRTPTIFLAHGSPFLLDDAEWIGQLGAWARAMPRPTSVLMLSAHWEQKPVTLGSTRMRKRGRPQA